MAFDYYNFGLFLRRLRAHTGLTFQQASFMTGVPIEDIKAFEVGKKKITVEEFCKLLNGYNYSVPDIFIQFCGGLRSPGIKAAEDGAV